MSIQATTESAILERAVRASQPALRPEVAQAILAIQFGSEDREEMQRLADRAKDGSLAPDEEVQIEKYERVGHYLAILQSAARMALRSVDHGQS